MRSLLVVPRLMMLGGGAMVLGPVFMMLRGIPYHKKVNDR
jgi:hypothetical protein